VTASFSALQRAENSSMSAALTNNAT